MKKTSITVGGENLKRVPFKLWLNFQADRPGTTARAFYMRIRRRNLPIPPAIRRSSRIVYVQVPSQLAREIEPSSPPPKPEHTKRKIPASLKKQCLCGQTCERGEICERCRAIERRLRDYRDPHPSRLLGKYMQAYPLNLPSEL